MGNAEKKGWKEKLVSEFTEYWINVAYLALVFAAFTQYRRIILAIHDVTYTNYWVSLIEALILAKVIMIGDVVGLGRGLEHKPLIYPTLYKTVVFCALIAVFRVVEHILRQYPRALGERHSRGARLQHDCLRRLDPIFYCQGNRAGVRGRQSSSTLFPQAIDKKTLSGRLTT